MIEAYGDCNLKNSCSPEAFILKSPFEAVFQLLRCKIVKPNHGLNFEHAKSFFGLFRCVSSNLFGTFLRCG